MTIQRGPLCLLRAPPVCCKLQLARVSYCTWGCHDRTCRTNARPPVADRSNKPGGPSRPPTQSPSSEHALSCAASRWPTARTRVRWERNLTMYTRTWRRSLSSPPGCPDAIAGIQTAAAAAAAAARRRVTHMHTSAWPLPTSEDGPKRKKAKRIALLSICELAGLAASPLRLACARGQNSTLRRDGARLCYLSFSFFFQCSR
ncbi:hypothetical protein C8Q73DRAFT_14071 [Cubamyces lactineus]|nr:hypothetical protein C8Q73DRAFT_14071 [Cubamyces lactineus]